MDGYKFYDFYLAHGGILLVPLFLTIVLKHKINVGSWKYTFNTVLSITLIVGLLNMLIHRVSGEWANYLFLCKAPIVDNPLLLVTNWPYYIPFLMFVGFLHMLFVYHIFKIFKRVEL